MYAKYFLSLQDVHVVLVSSQVKQELLQTSHVRVALFANVPSGHVDPQVVPFKNVVDEQDMHSVFYPP